MGDMIKGNDAIAEAAVRAGVQLYAGYPITPSTEVMEYLSWRMPELGRTFIQAESELAGINMVLGFAFCGKRALTASSGPGISLKQEGISYISKYRLPCVVLNVVRYGNGLGSLRSGQSDYFRDTRGGGNGDYRCIVLAPSSVQESVDLMYLAFDLAERYRIVTEVMSESALGQMMEPCEFPPMQELTVQDWALDGKYTHERRVAFMENYVTTAHENNARYEEIKEKEQRYEAVGLEDAEYVFVSYGIPGRVTHGVVNELRARGEKVGLIRPITLWPFPEKAFEQVNPNVKGFITAELNDYGQMVDDVALSVKKKLRTDIPVYCLPYVFEMVKRKDVFRDFEKIRQGQWKEVY